MLKYRAVKFQFLSKEVKTKMAEQKKSSSAVIVILIVIIVIAIVLAVARAKKAAGPAVPTPIPGTEIPAPPADTEGLPPGIPAPPEPPRPPGK